MKGFCECGCGQLTNLATQSSIRNGYVRGEPMRFVLGHSARVQQRREPRFSRFIDTNGYVILTGYGWHPNAGKNGSIKEHVLIAAAALGRPLPKGAIVHHANGDSTDNRPENLVILQDQALHMLVHQRQRAWEACGHADWRKCTHCKEYGPPEAMLMEGSRKAYHRICKRRYEKAMRAQRKTARQRANAA